MRGAVAVERDADQKSFAHKKGEKLLRHVVAVGLHGVGHGETAGVVSALKAHERFKKGQADQRRLAALKGEGDLAVRIAKSAAHQRLQCFRCHAGVDGGLPSGHDVRIKQYRQCMLHAPDTGLTMIESAGIKAPFGAGRPPRHWGSGISPESRREKIAAMALR